MATREPGEHYSPEPNILERRAVRFLAGLRPDAEHRADGGHEADGRLLTATTRRHVTVAAAAGIVSGSLIGGAEIWVRQGWLDRLEGLDWQAQLPYWSAFFAFSGVVSGIEIALLYWLALRGVAAVSHQAGQPLGEAGYPGLRTHGLARGALEFSNPRVRILGIDPYAYVAGWRLAAKNIAYKMKVGVSSFLLRVFMRRVLTRVAIRGFLPLIAGPLYAAWNAIIIWRIMHEARIRTLGPAAIERFLEETVAQAGRPADRVADLMLQGAAEMVKRGGDAHPNHVHLLLRLQETLGREGDLEDGWADRTAVLDRLEPAERERVLATLVLAAIIGSRIHRRQKALLGEACATCRASFRPKALKSLHRDLTNGLAIKVEDLARVCA